ncbi:MAG: DinB family protein [Anaerolineaceae bacterium]|nr:DinB family protein [Anaerolineaceae bacterium]
MTEKNKHQAGYETIDTLFRHNLWANTNLFDQCAQLSEEQLNSKVIGTYGSIFDTLEHIANAERSYWHRLKTGQPFRKPEAAPKPTISELQELTQVSGAGLIEIAPTIQPQDSVDVNWEGTPRSVPGAVILTQVINHATEHRAQIMVMLTQLGLQPPELDSWTFFDEGDR